MTKVANKKLEASNIKKCLIYSNAGGDTVDITPGIIDLKYYESLLTNSIKLQVTFVDTGYTINETSLIEGLPLVGQEKVEIELEDNLEQTKKLTLYVNNVDTPVNRSNKYVANLTLVSREFMMNEYTRVKKRYDGKISDSVTKILQDEYPFGLGAEVDSSLIEQTSNLYNFFGNNRKPFWILNWLAKKSIPQTGGGKGQTAGYFFFETDKGLNFKSIDSLMKEKPTLNLVYTETTDEKGTKISAGYDGKITKFAVVTSSSDVKKRLRTGAFNTKIISWNPLTFEFKTTFQKLGDIETGGKEYQSATNKEFPNNQDESFTRTVWVLEDPGVLPTGDVKTQLEKSDQRNLEETDILNMSGMRYNSLFNSVVAVNIVGNLKINVGQTIFIDYPKNERSKNPDVANQNGGKYLVLDLCHSFEKGSTITSMNLVRESTQRDATKKA